MADEFDEYEKLLEGTANGGGAPPEGGTDQAEKERSSRRDSEGKRERRDRSRSRERKRDKGRDRDNDFRQAEAGRGSRSRSRDRRHREERDRRDRERDRDRPRDRDRDRDRDRERDRYRDRDRDRGRDRGRDRDRERDRFAPRRRSPTPPEVRLAKERERELAELERATRTVFAYNINIKANEKDIFEFFCKVGEVTDIRLITDRHTKKSKGLAYVEFSKQEEVFGALTLTGQLLMGQPVMVKPAEAEKNLAWEAAQAAKQNAPADADLLSLGLGDVGLTAAVAVPPPAPVGPLKLQVTGFKQGLAENEIRQIFEPFGPLDSVTVLRDAAGQPTSVAFVVFKSGLDGQNAMTHWHGASLLDNVLNVTVATDLPAVQVPAPLVGVGELDDDDGGLKIDAQKRAALMNRLASSAGMVQPSAVPGAAPYAVPGLTTAAPVAGILPGGLLAPGVALPGVAAAAAAVPGLPGVAGVPGAVDLSLQQGLLGPASPIPTPCLLLKNMFDATSQTEPNWVAEVADDVRDEAAKFGTVLHLHVDKDSKGFVYIKFDSPTAAQAAAKVLHGRFYNGHMIQAEFQFLQTYNQFFGLQ